MALDSVPGAVLRPVGIMERWSTVRHDLGLYRCVQVAARYSIDQTPDLVTTLETALAKVILRHPPLCCGIIKEDQEESYFVRLESIDVSKRIDFRALDSSTQEEHEQSLIEIIELQHRQLWPDMHCEPVWKLIVVQSETLYPERIVFDAIFAWHHGIGDGISGMVFHRSLLEALNDPGTITMTNHIIDVPTSIKLFPPQEKMIKLKISWWFLLAAVWQSMRPKWLFPDSSPPWTGEVISAATVENFDTRVKLISVPSDDVASILRSCREQKTTLTCLIQALVASALAFRIPYAASFASSTPLSPRHLSGISASSDMAVQVCSLEYRYTPEAVSAVRWCSNPTQVTEQVWKMARNFRTSMAAEVARLPNDNVVGLLPYAGSLHKMFRSKIGKPREDTFQVSNLGTLKNEVDGEQGRWRIERTIFTQCGVVGSTLSFNVSSVVDGPLTISVTWMGDAIEEKLGGHIVEDVRYALKCIADGREVSLGHSV